MTCDIHAKTNQETCGAEQPTGKHFICTRPVGHEGDHVACGYTAHNLATWPKENDE